MYLSIYWTSNIYLCLEIPSYFRLIIPIRPKSLLYVYRYHVYIYIYVYIYVSISISISISIFMCISICISISISIYLCVFPFVFVYLYVFTSCKDMYRYTYVFRYTISTYIHTSMGGTNIFRPSWLTAVCACWPPWAAGQWSIGSC